MGLSGCCSNRQSDPHLTGFPLAAALLNQFMVLAWLILLLSIFNYTEFNPQTGKSGFPHRLFVLPVTSFQLVAVPMIGGAAVAGLTAAIWMWRSTAPWLFLVAVASYLVLYQGISWTLASAGPLRLIILGALAFGFIAMPIVFSWKGLPGMYAYALFVGIAGLSFFTSWIWVARQRSGGVFNRAVTDRPYSLGAATAGVLHERPDSLLFAKRLSRRTRPFVSAAAAQFWFEWRRSGFLLPALIGFLLLIFIGPVSWHFRNDADFSFRLLAASLAMPLILAAPVGKAFSKPELWSADLGLSAFIAVRPLATHEMVAIKMKVAAASAMLSWLFVLLFLGLWLPFANLERRDRCTVCFKAIPRRANRHSGRDSRCLSDMAVSGCRLVDRTFRQQSAVFAFGGALCAFAAAPDPVPLHGRSPTSWLRTWIRTDPDAFLAWLIWIAAAAVIAKCVLAVFSWRKVATGFVPPVLWGLDWDDGLHDRIGGFAAIPSIAAVSDTRRPALHSTGADRPCRVVAGQKPPCLMWFVGAVYDRAIPGISEIRRGHRPRLQTRTRSGHNHDVARLKRNVQIRSTDQSV